MMSLPRKDDIFGDQSHVIALFSVTGSRLTYNGMTRYSSRIFIVAGSLSLFGMVQDLIFQRLLSQATMGARNGPQATIAVDA